MRRFTEGIVFLGLGCLLGLGVASYRGGLLDGFVLAQGEKTPAKKADPPGGIFSPPGTSESGAVVPAPNEPPFKGKIGRTISESTPDWPPLARAKKGAPNILYIVLDDVGYAALGCYGSPINKTPHLDKLAKGGLRYNNFHTTALCSPSRSCMMTGRNHHSNAMAAITEVSTGYPGYNGRIPLSHGMLSEILTPFGWSAFAIGKWHLTPAEDMNLGCNRKWWPLGRGFDRFYGFLGGEADQWYPWLAYDNHFIQPPKTPQEGYHCIPDLTEKAKMFIADLKQVAPERPFFLYYCPGSCHAPHHVPQEWIEKYKGAFDAGWDDYREKTLANQIKMGIAPPGTKLSPHDPDVPEWKTLNKEEKEVYTHQMEVYAAYLSYIDHHIGELVAFLEELGQLDNTMIIAVSDNGASPEGGPDGSFNENLFFNNAPQPLSLSLKHLKDWGGPSTYPHYSWGWAWATNTPFRRWKREVARGGTSDLCIVHWPKGFKAKDAIRHQFTHAIDLVPTVLDVLKIKMPTSINGVAQDPLEGVSFKKTFDDPDVKIPREAQYFEMLGTRALYIDGWRAYAPWQTLGTQITPKDLDNAKWMLFNINEDFSESTDLAAKFPDKLSEMKQLWFMQASKYKVFPLDASSVERLASPRPQMSGPRDKYVYYPGTGEVESSNAVDVRNRSFNIVADVEVPKTGAEGVLLAHGSSFGGYTFFVKDGTLRYSHNYLGITEYKAVSKEKISAGGHALKVEFERTGPPDFKIGRGAPGIAKLFIDGKQVGEGKVDITCPLAYGLSGDGLACGRDTLTAVSADYLGSEFPFTGTIRRVTVTVGKDQHPTAPVTQRND